MLEDAVPWFGGSVESQRVTFCRLVVGGSDVTFTELCSRFGISRKTGYKWLNRYLDGGVESLRDVSRAPHSSPTRTSVEMEGKVLEIRDEHPAWGGRKISRVLSNRGNTNVPSPATITAILRRHDKIQSAEPHAGGFVSFEADKPNDMWQMDFKGWFMCGTGRCDPFDVLDDYSRYNLCLEAGNSQDGTTVQASLVNTFRTYGIPKWVLCDNGQPWGTSQAGFRWTKLTVWLVDLGISVTHSRPRHPQTLGKDERFHRTLKLEVISTKEWDSHQQIQTAFDKWRHIYNHERPHDSLGLEVPASRYQPSQRPMPATIEPVDYPVGYEVRKVDNQARIRFQGNRYKIGKPFTGRRIGIIPTTTDGVFNVVYRHHHIKTINMTQ